MRDDAVRCAGLALATLLLPVVAFAQGFAGLGTPAEEFENPDPGYAITFPEDHGPHPAFRIEWWYVTANLEAEDGTPYGIQWTLFRTALAPFEDEGWDSPQLWMGHMGLTTPTDHHVAERLARGGVGQAGVTAEPFAAFIDDWRMEGPTLSDVTMTASGETAGYTLELSADGPFVMQGIDGYSVKAASGQASYYYSQPFYEASGTLNLPEGNVAVTGTAWLDREWSSQPLSEGQTGWDWFSLGFEGGERLMGFRLRDETAGDYTSATWIAPDGTPTPYGDGALTATPLESHDTAAGPTVPVEWRVELPDRGLDVTVSALNPDAWMATAFPYWEGPVTVTGSHEGRGYLEMTGYE